MIDSTEDLKKELSILTFKKKTIVELGLLDEFSFSELLELKKVKYKRKGFKKWEISYELATSKGQFLLRLIILLAFISILAIKLIPSIINLYIIIEKYFENYAVGASIVATIIVTSIIWIVSKSIKYIKIALNYYLG